MIEHMSKDDIVFGTIKEITNKVNEAVQSQQFQNLGEQIRQSVESATSQIKSASNTATENAKKANGKAKSNLEPNSTDYEMPRHYTNIQNAPAAKDTPFFGKRIKRTLGLGSMIGGTVGLIFTGIPALVFLFLWLLSRMNPFFLGGLIVFGILATLLGILSARGGRLHEIIRTSRIPASIRTESG